MSAANPLGDREPTGREDWVQLAQKALAGKPLDSLNVLTEERLKIEPLYPRARDLEPIAGRDAGRPWTIVQRVDHPDPAAANRLALLDLENGATGLALISSGAPSAYGFGAPPGALDRALEGVHLDLIEIQLEPSPSEGDAVATEMADLAARRGLPVERLEISFGLDPLGAFVATGTLPEGWAGALAGACGKLRNAGFTSCLVRADGRPYHAAGAGEAQELACVLASAVAYLRALDDWAPEGALRSIALRLVAGSDHVLTVAKFRAARLLWARLAEELGAAGVPARIEAETAWREQTRLDPWTNVLRGTIAALSAGIGGADSITVLPFTLSLGLPDAFARRVSRNTGLILVEEANLHRVADPAAGSGSLEMLTETLAERAWNLFREIERAGGMAAALASGTVRGLIEQTREERERRLGSGEATIVGTTAYLNAAELQVTVLVEAPGPSAAEPSNDSAPLPSRRLAEPFE